LSVVKPKPNHLLTNWTTQPNSNCSKAKTKVIADNFQHSIENHSTTEFGFLISSVNTCGKTQNFGREFWIILKHCLLLSIDIM